ncbi:MAG: hypothetical protein GXP00_00675 [Alphaproteobacteria bacterium]|nr:hypothetical protein [Alphaproteobacteria bacterium]
MAYRKSLIFSLLVITTLLLFYTEVKADMRRNPTGVNVSTTRPTSLSIRFADNQGAQFTTTEALFCMRLQSNGACAAGTILGRLPVVFDRGSTSVGRSNITDIMTIPFSVVRTAVSQARQGAFSDFFYVRRFSPVGNADLGAGPGVDVFVSVTCRLAGGTSRTPLSFSNVKIMGLDDNNATGQKIITLDPKNLETGRVIANLEYTGRGQLQGWWEVRRPGDPEITPLDLLPEASLTQAERAKQTRFFRVKYFNITLPNTGSYDLVGPAYSELPADLGGAYRLLLRLKVSRDREALSNLTILPAAPVPPVTPPPSLGATGASKKIRATTPATTEPRLSFSGGAAGFPIFPLEYRVPANLSAFSVKELSARLMTDGKDYSLTWRPVDDSRLVVKLVLYTPEGSQTYYLPAANHISHLPMSWAKGVPPTGATVTLLGPDNAQMGKEIRLEITPLKPEE